MRFLKLLKLKTRLTISLKFFTIISIFVAISFLFSGIGLWKLTESTTRIKDIVDISVMKIELANQINNDLLIISRSEKNMLISEKKSENQTGITVETISEITTIISKVNEITTTIAAAIEEQSATTKEIATSINLASDAGGAISETIIGVANSAEKVSEDIFEINQSSDDIVIQSTDVNSSSEELSALAENLQTMAAKFKI